MALKIKLIKLQLLLLIFFSSPCNAHQLYESYLFIDVSNPNLTQLRWEVESNNLETVFQLDANKNEIISWKELKQSSTAIIHYLKPHLQITIDKQAVDLNFSSFKLERKDDQTFLIFSSSIPTQAPVESLNINYDLFFDIDPKQICYVNIQQKENKAPIIETLKPGKQSISLLLHSFSLSLSHSMLNLFIEGIWHIWMGWDHLLFLLMLLISCISPYLVSRSGILIVKDIIKVVTSFSIAHSITLVLSSLDIILLPVKPIEIIIALSVLITALANLCRWQIPLYGATFIFGLIHGFGFANALQKMTLEGDFFIYLLLSFNLGVEAGQLVLVLMALPLLMTLKKQTTLFPMSINVISSLTALAAIKWVVERI
jgi:hypothetical protein